MLFSVGLQLHAANTTDRPVAMTAASTDFGIFTMTPSSCPTGHEEPRGSAQESRRFEAMLGIEPRWRALQALASATRPHRHSPETGESRHPTVGVTRNRWKNSPEGP